MDVRRLFGINGKVIVTGKQSSIDFKTVNEKAIKVGYIVTPSACSKAALDIISMEPVSYNSTFYKSWEDITSRNRIELAIDQILHYLIGYGTGFEYGNGYVPNDEPAIIPFEKYKVIDSCTPEEMRDDILKMLSSGIALSSDMINAMIEFLEEYKFIKDLDLDSIANKEAQAVISVKTGILPRGSISMLRCLVYRYTGNAMLIKDRSTLRLIAGKSQDVVLKDCLSDSQMKILAQCFYRYKPIFLAMKSGNEHTINKIRRYAVKEHKPLKAGVFERCLNPADEAKTLDEVRNSLNTISNYKKITLLNAILERVNMKDTSGRLFVIRNGKMFVREDYKVGSNVSYLCKLYAVIWDNLIESVKSKGFKSYKLPKVNLTAPTSEKNFIGEYPFGSYLGVGSEHSVFGIYWRNEWGVRDYDLHLTTLSGNSYGWCYNYSGDGVIYSGDMTNADPEATEIFYLRNGIEDSILHINKYSYYGAGDHKNMYKLFVANHDFSDKSTPNRRRESGAWMVDPNEILASAMVDFGDSEESCPAVIYDNKIYFINLRSGNRRVHNDSHNKIIQQQTKIKTQSMILIEDVLKAADMIDMSDSKEDVSVDLDLTEPTKSQIIGIFS